ncbi:MAG: sensor histidine kinase, partial [Proteobacteria bacterium]|nr:sensor histidine kinase [Pseudomonadota bacterium]
FMPSMSTAMALIFCSHYLVLPEKSKWLTLIVWMTAGLLICVGVLSFIVALPLLIRLMYIFLIPAIIQVLIVPLILAFKKDRFAKLFLIAWLPLVIGALTFTLIRLGMTVDIPQGAELAFGSIWEAVFLSVCLGDKFNQIKKQEINYLERIRQEEMLAREAEILAESRHREKLIIEREAVANRNLVRVIVHDIANPLNIILNYSDVIDRNDLNVVDAQKYLQKIHKAAEHQHEIIEHVRELEALNSGKMRIKLVPVSVQESIDTLKDFLQKKFEDKNIVFDVIGSDPELYVMAEQRSFVYNVLANLVSNAIKFSPDGSHIRCEIEASEKFVNMTIADQGIGMEADLLAQIFEISSPTTRLGLNGEKGTGFGLPIVKSYMDKYEAQLSVESRAIEDDALQHGTRFTLILVRGFPSDLAGQ